MSDDPPHRPSPGGVSAQGCAMDHRKATKAASGRELGISDDGDVYSGGRIRSYWGVFSKEVDWGSAIHCNTTDYVSM